MQWFVHPQIGELNKALGHVNSASRIELVLASTLRADIPMKLKLLRWTIRQNNSTYECIENIVLQLGPLPMQRPTGASWGREKQQARSAASYSVLLSHEMQGASWSAAKWA
jgi:hypothetical protein